MIDYNLPVQKQESKNRYGAMMASTDMTVMSSQDLQ
jgi:hypothetical protein